MAYKNFTLIIVIRILLLIITIFLFFYLMNRERYLLSTLIIGVIIIVQTWMLIRYVDRTNRKLTLFLQSIRHADFSTSFSDYKLGKTFGNLSLEFNKVIDEFQKYRAENEENFQYLQTLVQHISIGIIVFTRDGKVDVFNNSAKKLFDRRHLRFVQDLRQIKETLPETLLKLEAGETTLIKLFINNELLQLSVSATEFRMRGDDFVLVSLQDISSELDEKEIESWQKLIRVLTHEIMNSITPISSLASTVREVMFTENEDKLQIRDLDEEDTESMEKAISTIQSRSEGLLNFVKVYRNLTRIPKPNFRYFRVSELFDRSRELLKPKIDGMSISCGSRVFPPDMMITADPDLIDQVIINLMLNAIDAVKDVEKPEISILATLNNNNRVVIDFKDNGSGIKPDIMDKIFMPFFTSKKSGSGIGLSLSRQIMHLHKGSITVKSKPGEGTVFTLTF